MEKKIPTTTANETEERKTESMTPSEKEKIAREERKRQAFRNAASNIICDGFD